MNMDKFKNNKNVLIVGAIIVLLIIVGIFLTSSKKASNSGDRAGEDVLPDVEVLPTVDASVKVDLKADAKKENVNLTVTGVPSGTTEIEYELSYDALVDGESVPKGVIGTIPFDGKEPIKRGITIGTCSSGTCKYDKGITSIKALLKFTGSYGSRLFEKEYKI